MTSGKTGKPAVSLSPALMGNSISGKVAFAVMHNGIQKFRLCLLKKPTREFFSTLRLPV